MLGGCVDLGAEFYVDGTTIPEVDWDVGPSWAGLLPISGDKGETRKVRYFPERFCPMATFACILKLIRSCSSGSTLPDLLELMTH